MLPTWVSGPLEVPISHPENQDDSGFSLSAKMKCFQPGEITKVIKSLPLPLARSPGFQRMALDPVPILATKLWSLTQLEGHSGNSGPRENGDGKAIEQW